MRLPENPLDWYSENHVVEVKFVDGSRQRGLSHFSRDATFGGGAKERDLESWSV